MIVIIIIIILLFMMIGSYPRYPYNVGWGYYPFSGIGLVILILVILLLAGVI
jgi:hypothetical protein